MERILDVSKLVKSILACDEKARNSDDYLYSAICRTRLLEKNINPDRITICDGMIRRKELGIPPYETVRRTRQRIQQHYPGLRGSADVEAMRMVKEGEFKNYARSVEV